jgi:drug/metabolite transporter (DMT)-like permease
MPLLWFFLALGGALSNAIFNVTIKKIMKDIDPFILLTWTYLFGGFVLSLFVIAHGVPDIDASFVPTLFLIMIMGIVSLSLYFFSVRMTDISLCIPMLSFTPVFLILTSSLILHESPSMTGIVGICCIAAGAYLISYSPEEGIFQPFRNIITQKGVAFMLVVALMFAVEVNFDKMLVMESDPYFSAAISFLAFGLSFLVISVIRTRSIHLIRTQDFFPFLFSGTILATEALTINFAYTLAIVPFVISVKRMSILLTVIMGGILLKEQGQAQRLLASSVMVLGAVIIAIS